MPAQSSLEELVLNAIAAGYDTRNKISGVLGIHYTSIYRIISKLCEEQRVIDIPIENGENQYVLAIRERYRLWSFTHTNVILHNFPPQQYALTDLQVAFRLSAFSIYYYPDTIDILGDRTLYIVASDVVTTICNHLEHNIHYANFLPMLVIEDGIAVSHELLDTLKTCVEYHLPIIWGNPDLQHPYTLWQTPPICTLDATPSPRLDDILHHMRNEPERGFTTNDIATLSHVGRETVRKYLRILLSKGQVRKVDRGNCADAFWYAV